MAKVLYQGMVVCFTGRMRMPRASIEAITVRAGLHVTDKADRARALVVGQQADAARPSVKVRAASNMGIPSLTEDEFLRALETLAPDSDQPTGSVAPAGSPRTPNDVLAQWDVAPGANTCAI